jgi:Protein phosphatase 2C
MQFNLAVDLPSDLPFALSHTKSVRDDPRIQSFIKQSRSAQDFIKTGKSGNMTWLVECDGHGNDEYIDWLRTAIDWNQIVTEPDPVRSLHRLYEKSPIFEHTLHSGATFSMARILENPTSGECLVECINVGDSTTLVFVNNRLTYMNEGHTASNPVEMERLRQMATTRRSKYTILQGIKPSVVSQNTITHVPSPKVSFQYRNSVATQLLDLVPTQSMGHLGITGIKPEKHTVHCYRGDKIRVMVCSDGVTEMIRTENKEDIDILAMNSAVDIGDFIVGRWAQKWKYMDPKTGKILGESQFDAMEWDDISLALWERPPLASPLSMELDGLSL